MAHKLPSTESFSDAAFDPTDWQQPCLYWPTLLWNSASGGEPSGFGINPSYSELHNAYQGAFGVVTALRSPQGDGSRRACCHTFRPDFREDSDVRLEFAFRRVTGGSNFHADSTWTGVGCRIANSAGGQLVDTGLFDEGVEAPTGYYFMLNSRTAGALIYLKAQFIKVVGPTTPSGASTVNLLAETTISRIPGETRKHLPADRSRTIRMTCETSGGAAELRGYFYNWETQEEELVLSHDDGTFPITAAGHAGFITTSELSDPANVDYRFIHGVSAFQVSDLSGDIVFRDEFKRTNAINAVRVGPDKFLRYGDSVASQFTGDLGGSDSDPTWAKEIYRASGLEKLEFNTTHPGGWHLSQNPPDNEYVQSATVEFEFGAGTSTRIVGVAARAAVSSTVTIDWTRYTSPRARGYHVAIEQITTGFAMRVLRNGATIAYRTLNQSGDPATISVTGVYDLALHVENRDGGSPSKGNVHLSPTIDGESLTEWFFLAPGIIEESDGSLTDTGSDRVLSGGAIGFFASSQGGDSLFVHSFKENDVVLALDEREQAGVNLGNERDGVGGVLTVPYEWGVSTEYIDYSEAIPFDSMHVHRHATASKHRRKWTIHSDAATTEEASTLRAFFSEHEGLGIPFYWQCPEGDSVVACFGADSIRIEKIDKKTLTFRAQVYELLGVGAVNIPGVTGNPGGSGDHPVARFESFGESLNIVASGGFDEADDPDGPPRFPVFFFPDNYGPFTVKVLLEELVGFTSSGEEIRGAAPAPRGGTRVHYDLSGTAVEGKHYSISAADQSPLLIPEGETEGTFTVTILDRSPSYFNEVRLDMRLGNDSDAELYFKNVELHAHIRPISPPPKITLDQATQSIPAGEATLVTINVSKVSGSSTHPDERIFPWLELDPTSTLVEGVDWVWLPDDGAPFGHSIYNIGNNASEANMRLQVRQTAQAGDFLKFRLWHDRSDQEDANIFTLTHDMRLERYDNTVEVFPGEFSDNAHGPASAGAVSYLINRDPVKRTPHGDPVWFFEHTDNDPTRTIGYNRKSSSAHTFCAGPRSDSVGNVNNMPGAQEGLKAYTFASMYFAKPTNRELPRFLQFGMRDRGFQWEAPQNPPGTTPSAATEENLWTTLYDSTATFITDGVQVDYAVRNYSQVLFNATVQSVVSEQELLLKLHPTRKALTTETWEIGDAYTVHPNVGYARNFNLVIDTQSDPSGAVEFDGAYWSVYLESGSWADFGTVTYGFEVEQIRDHTGELVDYLRFWFLYHMTSSARLGDASNKIWHPFYWGLDGETHETNIGKGLVAFWPLHLTSDSPISTSPLPRFSPKRGFFRTPHGNAEVDVNGISTVTINVVP